MSEDPETILSNFATQYDGKIENLVSNLENTSQRGSRDRHFFNNGIKGFLDSKVHFLCSRSKYVLWKYENEMRRKHRVGPLSLREYLDASIEYIMPEDPEEIMDLENFERRNLHNLGNFLLTERASNSDLGNALPVDKAARMKTSAYLTHQEVAYTILKNGEWTINDVAAREQQIANFAFRYWEVGVKTNAPTGKTSL